jgi:hypothetical protein
LLRQLLRGLGTEFPLDQMDNVTLSHPHDTDIPTDLPLPRWSWDGLVRLP